MDDGRHHISIPIPYLSASDQPDVKDHTPYHSAEVGSSFHKLVPLATESSPFITSCTIPQASSRIVVLKVFLGKGKLLRQVIVERSIRPTSNKTVETKK
jgi:hypothetical protein